MPRSSCIGALSLSCAAVLLAFPGDENWNSLPIIFETNAVVRSMEFYRGELVVGGAFSSVGGVSVVNVARWSGGKWSGLGEGIPDGVEALTVCAEDLVVGGQFTESGGRTLTNIARWDGDRWSPLGDGLSGGVVNTLLCHGGLVYAGGTFIRSGGRTVNNLAVWNGIRWEALGGGFTRTVSSSATVRAMAMNDLKLYVGGQEFTEVGGIQARNIAVWDGNAWDGLGSGIDGRYGGTVYSMASSESELFVGGFFDNVGGLPSAHFAVWCIPLEIQISQVGAEVNISWPVTGSNFVLEASSELPTTNWASVPTEPIVVDQRLVVTNTIREPERYYRLRK